MHTHTKYNYTVQKFRVQSGLVRIFLLNLHFPIELEPASLTCLARSILAYVLLVACMIVSEWTYMPRSEHMLPLQSVLRRCTPRENVKSLHTTRGLPLGQTLSTIFSGMHCDEGGRNRES